MTPVRASVLEATPPDDERGVTARHQLREDGRTVRELFVLKVLLLAAVVVIFFFTFKLVDHHFLFEPLNGLLAARREAAGKHALSRHRARDYDI